MTARSTKREVRQVVLELEHKEGFGSAVVFQTRREFGEIAASQVDFPREDWEALGEPERITVTIEAGERPGEEQGE